ncbi:MAG: prolipoprotein diacylglyceryl transferase family protein, partial [Candidatus Binatia bacterium]
QLVGRAPRLEPGLWLAVAVATAALAGSRALYLALDARRSNLAPNGLDSVGGIAAGLGAAVVWARVVRVPAGAALDVVVPPGLLALAFGRVGCFLAGCCYGKPTALAWGVVFPELGPPARHPLQLYAAAGDAALALWLLAAGGPPGAVAGRGLVGYALLRAGLELLRDPAAADLVAGGPLSLAQLMALALAIVGLAVLRLARPRTVD